YLVFNEGYAASDGDTLVRADLCAEAIRLGRIMGELVPDNSEVRGLLALMLLQDSRRATRLNREGEIEALYAYLMRLRPSPVIELNHAVAVAMARGPAHGLQLIEAIRVREELDDYHLMWAARADLLRRLEQWAE